MNKMEIYHRSARTQSEVVSFPQLWTIGRLVPLIISCEAISRHILQTCRLVYVLLCVLCVLLPTLLCQLTTLRFLLFNYRLYFCFFPHSTFCHSTFSLRTLYLDVVCQDLQQPKLSSNINTMPSNCSRCTHNIQENDRLTARIAVLQAQL